MPLRLLIVIPTYNEVDNIQAIVPRILELPFGFEVLVVDDNSPDGTAEAVRRLQASESRVHLLERPGKMGLGSAYIAGFRYALAQGFDVVFEMDADFSHDPAALATFLRELPEYDVVLGSRYLHGVTVVNWPLRRLILSYGANAYVRFLTGLPLQDATGGFKAFRRAALLAIDLDQIRSDGYSFQVEVNFQLWRQGFRIREIPIVFADRRVGISKMSRKIIWEAIGMVGRLALTRIFVRAPRNGPLAGDGTAPEDVILRDAIEPILARLDRRSVPRPAPSGPGPVGGATG